jgi:hypothetical protein
VDESVKWDFVVTIDVSQTPERSDVLCTKSKHGGWCFGLISDDPNRGHKVGREGERCAVDESMRVGDE